MDTCWDRLARSMPDCVSPLETQAARHIYIANDTVSHVLDCFTRNARSAIGAVLHQAAVLLPSSLNLNLFEPFVVKKLFHIHGLARLTRPDSLECVVMIRRGDRY